jgi:hypothetical protein
MDIIVKNRNLNDKRNYIVKKDGGSGSGIYPANNKYGY